MDPGQLPSYTWLPQPLDHCPGEPWRYETPKVLQQRVRAPWYSPLQGDPSHRQFDRYPDIQPWRVTAMGFRHQDTYPLAVKKALHYLCRIFEGHLAPTPMRFFPPAIRTPVWEDHMRSLEWRRHEEDPLYQVATYLASLDYLFDEQASILREQTHRAEQAELAVRLQQIRAAQAEARAAAAVSSEAVAQESLRQARDRRMQEWTRSGTPVPAIGEDHVLLGMPVIGWGPLLGTCRVPRLGTP